MIRAAFTMIELLIVVTIIGVLMGLLVVAIPDVIYNAKALKTASKMDAILQGLSGIGQQEGSASMLMQRDAWLPGVWQFDTSGTYSLQMPAVVVGPRTNAFITQAELDAKPYLFGFPWGKNDYLGIPPNPTADANSVTRSEPSDPSNPTRYFSNVTIDQMNVDLGYNDAAAQPHISSISLLMMSGILPAEDPVTAYLTDRSPERAWNDAWGNPLVLAWALFQPGGQSPGSDANNPAQNIAGGRCKEAGSQYNYSRSVYIAIASAGPMPYEVRPSGSGISQGQVSSGTYTTTDLATWRTSILPQIWAEATTVCQGRTTYGVANPPGDWNADAFDRPPWTGVKKAKLTVNGTKLRCQLTSPHEFK